MFTNFSVLKFYWSDSSSFLLDLTFLFAIDPDYSTKHNLVAVIVETRLPFCCDTVL